MKKLVFLFLTILLITGCQITNYNNISYDKIINQVISKNNKLSNETKAGYKYYLPKEISIEKDSANNSILNYKGTKLYLYVDTTSYFYNIKDDYKENKDIFYSKKLNNKNKFGYIQINRVDNLYFIEMMYNYSKIETFAKEKDLKDVVYFSSLILSSIRFNRDVLTSLISETTINNKEEVYNIFNPTDSATDYLDWVENIYKDYDGTIKDEDSITLE